MIDKVFDLCVCALVVIGRITGLSYEAVNVLIFVVLWPVCTLLLICAVWRQRLMIRELQRQLAAARTEGERK